MYVFVALITYRVSARPFVYLPFMDNTRLAISATVLLAELRRRD